MKSFRYRDKHLNRSFPQFIHATIDESVFSLLTIFIVECLIRTKGSKDCNRIYTIFVDFVKKWNNLEGKQVFIIKLFQIMEKETLVLRFIEFGEHVTEIYNFSEDFMKHALNVYEEKLRTRFVLKKAAEVFGVYLKLNDILFPGENIGCQLLGTFGIHGNSICLYYSEEMQAVDMSTRKRIKQQISPFYFNPTQKTNTLSARLDELESKKNISSEVQGSKKKHSIRYFESLAETSSPVLSFKLDISNIASTCPHHQSYLFESSCGRQHCITCLHESIISESDFIHCSCGAEISEKNIRKILEIFENDPELKPSKKNESFKEIFKGFESFSESLTSNKFTDRSQEYSKEMSLHSNQLEKITYDDSSKKMTKNDEELKVSNESLLKYQGIYFSKTETCSCCKETLDESYFQIKCKCNSLAEKVVNHYCLSCRSRCTEKCLICGQVYNYFSIVALEIYNLTQLAIHQNNKS